MASHRKPIVTMSCLGRNGFFGNQLFQYAFLRFYAMRHSLAFQNGRWVGEYLFGHRASPVRVKLPKVFDHKVTANAVFHSSRPVYKGRDFNGYYHFFSTRYYLPYRQFFRYLFQPSRHVRDTLDQGMSRLRSMGRTVVAIHLRRGDYVKYLHEEWCYISPAEWYKDWLRTLWNTLDNPVLYIASDEIDQVVGDFREYAPVTSKEIFDNVPIPQKYRDNAPNLNGVSMSMDFFPDFHVLRSCDALAISNSTFSFSASMLNERATSFYRPHYETQRLAAFDPWDSYPLLLKG